ncbi:MAG: tetratricopeptide repeat protein [Candidatus Rifleibacteriota bacterium]
MPANGVVFKTTNSFPRLVIPFLIALFSISAIQQVSAETFYEGMMAFYLGDFKNAARIILDHAEKGNSDAQLTIGAMYARGEGLPADMTQAVKWWRKAADKNVVEAQYKLGGAYKDGKGVVRDLGESVKWFRKAAEGGYANAQRALAYSYYRGEGVNKDQKEAAKWFTKAAEQGDSHAQGILALIYATGLGLKTDMAEAYFWAYIATESDKNYRVLRNRMADELNPDQHKEIVLRARAWIENFNLNKK